MRNDLTIYDTYARNWWDGSQRFLRLLRNIVPARMRHFSQVVGPWSDKIVLDLGCGGGFMAEALARAGADTIGVDPSGPAVEAAREHARLENLHIDYRVGTGERIPLADEAVDCVVCVDVLEHVDSVDAVLGEITRVLKPGGLFLFDTINRTVVAKIIVVDLGETMLRLLPRGTHDPSKFITPVELSRKLAGRGYDVGPIVGLAPTGINRRLDFTFGRFPSTHVMYMGHARKAREPLRHHGCV
jgi:2-polyprenyl-6-hydroxyphenyl methylase/3-demethylubiquinone-9 3-methyltransferase